MAKSYKALKNVNLSEKGFTLSLLREDERDDLETLFTENYLGWNCDEGFLKKLGTVEVDENGEDEETIPEEDVKETEVEKTAEVTETEEEEEFEDLGADNQDTDDIDSFPDFEAMTIADIKEYANEHDVDIQGLKKKTDIIDAIYDDLA